jgi:hypothetical protein
MGLQYGFGSGVLYGIRTDIANGTPVRFGTLQDVSIDFSGEIKELYGQQQYPVDTARGKTKIEGKAKFAQISAGQFNNLFFGQTLQSGGQRLSAFNEQEYVSSQSAVTLQTSGAVASGATSVPLVSVAGLYVGMVASGSGSIPNGTTVASINVATNTIVLSAATTGAIIISTPLTFSPLSLNTSVAATAGATSLTFASTTGVAVGQTPSSTISGAIVAGTLVTAVTSTTVTLSQPLGAAVASGSAISFAAPPTATAANGGTFDLDLGPLYSETSEPLTLVTGTPTLSGTYAVNNTTGVYTFSPADQGVGVLLNYTYTDASTGFRILGTNLLMGATPRFEAVFTQNYGGNSTTLKLLACTSSKLTMPTKIDDYVINEIDFMAYANAAGNVFELSTSQ